MPRTKIGKRLSFYLVKLSNHPPLDILLILQVVSELRSPFALISIALVIMALVSQPRRVWRVAREITIVEVLNLMVLILLVGNIR